MSPQLSVSCSSVNDVSMPLREPPDSSLPDPAGGSVFTISAQTKAAVTRLALAQSSLGRSALVTSQRRAKPASARLTAPDWPFVTWPSLTRLGLIPAQPALDRRAPVQAGLTRTFIVFLLCGAMAATAASDDVSDTQQ